MENAYFYFFIMLFRSKCLHAKGLKLWQSNLFIYFNVRTLNLKPLKKKKQQKKPAIQLVLTKHVEIYFLLPVLYLANCTL